MSNKTNNNLNTGGNGEQRHKKMKTSTTISDSRINRNNNVNGFNELCHSIVLNETGLDREFSGCTMTYDSFKTTSYRKNRKDSQVDCVMDFNNHIIIITVDTPEKSKLEEEMELWETRANDEFGTILKEIDKAAFSDIYNEVSEYGFSTTPLSWHISAYSLDGNRKHTANVIRQTLEDYDMMENANVKKLVNKMMKIANA